MNYQKQPLQLKNLLRMDNLKYGYILILFMTETIKPFLMDSSFLNERLLDLLRCHCRYLSVVVVQKTT